MGFGLTPRPLPLRRWGWISAPCVNRNVHRMRGLKDRREPGIVEKHAVIRAHHDQPLEIELGDAAFKLLSRALRLRKSQCRERGETIRMSRDRRGRPVVGVARERSRGGPIELVETGAWSDRTCTSIPPASMSAIRPSPRSRSLWKTRSILSFIPRVCPIAFRNSGVEKCSSSVIVRIPLQRHTPLPNTQGPGRAKRAVK